MPEIKFIKVNELEEKYKNRDMYVYLDNENSFKDEYGHYNVKLLMLEVGKDIYGYGKFR